jgi:hypothetical protein
MSNVKAPSKALVKFGDVMFWIGIIFVVIFLLALFFIIF